MWTGLRHVRFFGEREGSRCMWFFFFQAEDGIRDTSVTGVQTCALPIFEQGGEPLMRHRGRLGEQESDELQPAQVIAYLQIGRASCRERVEITVVGTALQIRA